MKKMIRLIAVCAAAVVFSSCERVAPNYAGVLPSMVLSLI